MFHPNRSPWAAFRKALEQLAFSNTSVRDVQLLSMDREIGCMTSLNAQKRVNSSLRISHCTSHSIRSVFLHIDIFKMSMRIGTHITWLVLAQRACRTAKAWERQEQRPFDA